MWQKSGRAQTFDGIPFRVGWSKVPPYPTNITENSTYGFSGVDYEIFQWMGAKLNVSVRYLVATKEDIAENGQLPANIRLLLNNELDVITPAVYPIKAHRKMVDFSHPIRMDSYHLISFQDQEKNHLWALVTPFQWEVWLACLATIIAMAVTLRCFTACMKKQGEREHREVGAQPSIKPEIIQSIIYVLGFFTNHNAGHFSCSKLSFRILQGTLCIAAFFLINSYTCNLMSHMTVGLEKPGIDTFKDLAASNDVTLLVKKGNPLHIKLMEAKSGTQKVLGDTLRNNPQNVVANLNESMRMFLTKRHALFGNEMVKKYAEASTYSAFKQCADLQFSPPFPFIIPNCFGFAKNSPFINDFNHNMMHLHESGLIQFWQKKYNSKMDECSKKQKTSTTHAPMERRDYPSVFLIYLIGIFFSLLCFLLELAIFRVQRARKLRK